MGEHPNVERIRSALAAFSRDDVPAYRGHFSDDVVWHVGGSHPLSGDYRGRDALFDYFRRVNELTGGTLKVEAREILADDSHAGVFTRVTAQRDGRSMDVVLAQAFRLDAEGNITDYWALADDQEAVDAFWA